MAETTVAADAVPPVAVSDADAAPSVPPAASPANRRRPRVAAKRSHLGGTFPSVALAVVSGLLGVVLGYALGLRRGKKRGEAEETAVAEPNPPRALALTPPASPGPTLASPARAKRAPPRRAVGAETSVFAERTNVATANGISAISPRVKSSKPAKRPTTTDAHRSWTLSDFLAFADVKLGKVGEPVARWSVEGDVFEYPTGRLLARVAGVDVCRRVDDAAVLRDVVFDDSSRATETASKTVSQMSRKLLLFLDPETNEVMTQFEGQTVSPAAFPYQVTRYAFFDENESGEKNENGNDNDAPQRTTTGGSVTATVTVGAGVSKMTLTGASVAVSRGGFSDSNDKGSFDKSRVFSVPAFLDVETEDGGRHEAYESYDYFFGGSEEDDRGTTNTTHPTPVFAWTRFGACAPFGEACVLRALARRVASHENLPETVREYVRKHAPEYADAPKDAAEIRELQR
jgi:hypothetical protein